MGWRQGRWWWRFGATLGRTLAGWPTIPSSGLYFVRVGFARMHRSLGGVQGGLQQFRQLSLPYVEQVGGYGGPHWETLGETPLAVCLAWVMSCPRSLDIRGGMPRHRYSGIADGRSIIRLNLPPSILCSAGSLLSALLAFLGTATSLR